MFVSPERERTALRGKNIEDLGEIEEKGLLRRTTSVDLTDDGVRRRGKEREVRLERVADGMEEGAGLSSRRDKEAFALLVLLCKSYRPLGYPHAR